MIRSKIKLAIYPQASDSNAAMFLFITIKKNIITHIDQRVRLDQRGKSHTNRIFDINVSSKFTKLKEELNLLMSFQFSKNKFNPQYKWKDSIEYDDVIRNYLFLNKIKESDLLEFNFNVTTKETSKMVHEYCDGAISEIDFFQQYIPMIEKRLNISLSPNAKITKQYLNNN